MTLDIDEDVWAAEFGDEGEMSRVAMRSDVRDYVRSLVDGYLGERGLLDRRWLYRDEVGGSGSAGEGGEGADGRGADRVDA